MFRPNGWHLSNWRMLCALPGTQGDVSNDKKSGKGAKVYPDREGLGRSKGGVSTKIHIAADSKCRPGEVTSGAGFGR